MSRVDVAHYHYMCIHMLTPAYDRCRVGETPNLSEKNLLPAADLAIRATLRGNVFSPTSLWKVWFMNPFYIPCLENS